MEKTDIQGFMNTHTEQIFETMFSMRVEAAPEVVLGQKAERVSGSVGFGGDQVNGAVYLHLPARFAALLAACMLGTEPQSLTEAEINDVVGELTNMLAGGLKSWLSDSGRPCAGSTPAVIRGASFAIEAPEGIERLCLGFSSGANRFTVEVHFKQG